MHTLWYKRICQAPTFYTCKTNGLWYPHGNVTVTRSFPQDATFTHLPEWRRRSAHVCIRPFKSAIVRVWSISVAAGPTVVIVTWCSAGGDTGNAGVPCCKSVSWVWNTWSIEISKGDSEKSVGFFFFFFFCRGGQFKQHWIHISYHRSWWWLRDIPINKIKCGSKSL